MLIPLKKIIFQETRKHPTLIENLDKSLFPQTIGTQTIIHFSNGYGLSIIFANFSYGVEKGLFEVALLKKDKFENKWPLYYNEDFDNDVLGNLSFLEVVAIIEKVSKYE